MKCWLIYGSLGRGVTLLTTTTFLHVNGASNPSFPFILFCTVYCFGRGCIAVCWSLNIGVVNF